MLLMSRHIKCLKTKSLVFKDWEKTRTTVEERAIIEAEHSPVDNINESTKQLKNKLEILLLKLIYAIPT